MTQQQKHPLVRGHTNPSCTKHIQDGALAPPLKSWEAQGVKNRHASPCPSRWCGGREECPGAIAHAAPGTHMPAQLAKKVRKQLGLAEAVQLFFELHDQVQEFDARFVWRYIVRVELELILGFCSLSVFPRWSTLPPT